MYIHVYIYIITYERMWYIMSFTYDRIYIGEPMLGSNHSRHRCWNCICQIPCLFQGKPPPLNTQWGYRHWWFLGTPSNWLKSPWWFVWMPCLMAKSGYTTWIPYSVGYVASWIPLNLECLKAIFYFHCLLLNLHSLVISPHHGWSNSQCIPIVNPHGPSH